MGTYCLDMTEGCRDDPAMKEGVLPKDSSSFLLLGCK